MTTDAEIWALPMPPTPWTTETHKGYYAVSDANGDLVAETKNANVAVMIRDMPEKLAQLHSAEERLAELGEFTNDTSWAEGL